MFRKSRFIARLLLALAVLPIANGAVPREVSSTQPWVTRTWRTQDGLPENRVRALAQTPDGYLWVGTSSGLARFDGARFVVYARFNTPSMTDDNIRALAVAGDGSLWVATDGGGLLHHQNGGFRCFGSQEGLTNEFVAAVLADRRGDIWVGTNRGLFRFHDGKFERLDADLHLPNIAFFAVKQMADGRVVAGGPSGLFVFEDGRLRSYGTVRPVDGVYEIEALKDGSLWLGTNHGLRTTGSARRPGMRGMIGAILQDHAGRMWVGTEGDGLYEVQDRKEMSFRAPASLPDNSILALLEDREQNIWVGTADGLVRMSAPDVEVVSTRDGLSSDNVSTVYCGSGGTVWLTTVTGRAFQYVHGRIAPVPLAPPADGSRVRGAFEDRTGALWFGTGSQGAVRLVHGKAARFTTADGLRNNGIQAFFEDRSGDLWIGTTSGLSRWDGFGFRNYYIEDGLSYGWVRAIAADHNGDMLVGTDRGLNRFHDGRFVADPALSRDRVWSIYPEAPDTLWIGTRGAGLVRVRGGKAARITTEQGLLSNSIFQAIGDGKGNLWMSGPMGISAASIAELNAAADGKSESIGVLAYGTGDGLDSALNGGVQSSGCIAADGELWFPSVKGAIHFKPGLPRTAPPAPVRLESVVVDGKSVPFSGEIVIEPGKRRIDLEFTACSLRAPERVVFQYRLDALDGHWMPANGRSAHYDNLSPGRYRFRVKARDGSLEVGSSEASLLLIVQPQFHRTAWFYALVVLAAGAAVAGVLYFQERQARDRYNLRLAERNRIAREMHDTIVQGCVGVSTLIEAAVVSARTDQDLMLECLDNARIHLRLTLDEARQALTELRHNSFEGGLPAALAELAAAVSADKAIPISLEVSGREMPMPDSANRALLLVAREAVRNALQHASPGEVGVRLVYGSSDIRLEIRDDGCGFDPASACLAARGHFGILGMRERMEQLCGSLEVVSARASGTIVTARLPLEHVIGASTPGD